MTRLRTIVIALVTGPLTLAALLAGGSPAAMADVPGNAFTGPLTVTAVAFPWVLGTESGATRIWRTADNGSSWQVRWTGSGSPTALTAPDPLHAWALLGKRLIGTADGGAHWRTLTTLPLWPRGVRFVTPELGVATTTACPPDSSASHCPGYVEVSQDGGVRWHLRLASRDPVFATAARTGRIWVARSKTGDNGSIDFLTSTDAGRSWTRTGGLRGLGPLSAQLDVRLTATAPGRLAWATIFDVLSCTMHGCATVSLLGSADGGASWRTVTLPDRDRDECGPDRIALSIAADGTAWAATGRNGAACSPPLGPVYWRPAGQRTWQQRPPWKLAAIASLDAVSRNVAYAVGDQGTLSRSTDAGRHWTQLLPAPRSGTIGVLSGSLMLIGVALSVMMPSI